MLVVLTIWLAILMRLRRGRANEYRDLFNRQLLSDRLLAVLLWWEIGMNCNYRVRTSFFVKVSALYTVEVVGWSRTRIYSEEWEDFVDGRDWKWNIYVNIPENNYLFKDYQKVLDEAPFSGGVTFEGKKTREPLGGIVYEWQRVTQTIVIGNDYSHIWDRCTKDMSPDKGIPEHIEKDALELVDWMERHSYDVREF